MARTGWSSRQATQIMRLERALNWNIRHLQALGARQDPPIHWHAPETLMDRDKATRLLNALQVERNRRYARS